MGEEDGTKTGARALVESLVGEQAEYVFNLPGNGLYPFLHALFDYPQLRYVLGLHESAVVAMADGYARASGKVGFANTYMVPGTANALSSIYTAHRDRSPIVVTSTQQSTRTVGRDAYASTSDLVGMVRQFTKWSWEVTRPERLPEALHRAWKVAAAPPFGPVYLSIPSDVLAEPTETPLTEPSRPTAVPALGGPSQGDLDRMSRILLDAERVLIIGGKDLVTAGATDLAVELAEELGAGVVNEPWNGVMAFPQPHRLNLGDYSRVKFDRVGPDVVLNLGARMFTEALGVPEPAFPDGTRLLAMGSDSDDLGRMYATDLASLCDVGLGVRALLEACRGRLSDDRRARRREVIESFHAEMADEARDLLLTHHDEEPMSLPRLSTELNKVITPDMVILEQATTSAGMLRRYLEVSRPENYLSTGGSVQGWGLGAALGAQLGRPDDHVLGIIGDGGFAFGLQAAWSAGHYGIPVTVLVLNNQGYRSMRRGVHQRQQEATAADPDFGFDFDIDIPTVARAMGMQAERVSRPDELPEMVKASVESGQPSVVEIMISPEMRFVASQGAPMAL